MNNIEISELKKKQFNFYLKHNFIKPENNEEYNYIVDNALEFFSEFNYTIIDDKPYRTIFNLEFLHKGEVQEENIISLKKIPKPKNTCEYKYCKCKTKLKKIEADSRYPNWKRRFHKCCDYDMSFLSCSKEEKLKPIFRKIV